MTRLIDTYTNRIALSNTTYDKIWVYGIYDSCGNLVFMHYGRLNNIVSLSPFKSNPKFDANEIYTIVLVTACKDKMMAENALSMAINNSELQGNTPPYNIYSRAYNDYYFIQCLDNGKFYWTAQDVVKIFRVSQPALSNHLRGVIGYRHVKGLTFRIYNDLSGEMPKEIEIAGGFKKVRGEAGGYKTVPSDDIINRQNITEQELKDGINKIIEEGYMRMSALPMKLMRG
jgi:hypothetical protein